MHQSSSKWQCRFGTFVRSGFYTNRIRFSEMIALFEKAEFITEVSDARSWEHLPIKRQLLAANFLYLSDDNFMVSGFDVQLHKKS